VKSIAAIAGLVAIAVPLAGAVAEAPSPTSVFEGNATLTAKDGTTQTVHVSVQAWRIAGLATELPLRDFYVAHLLSGQMSTTIDGQTKEHLPGDFWTVKAAAGMRAKVVGEVAVLETIVVAKQ
jgi:hypothetical protein